MERYFPPAAKAQIDDLVAHLRGAFKERITRLDWMSPDTKRKALDKLAAAAERQDRLSGRVARLFGA